MRNDVPGEIAEELIAHYPSTGDAALRNLQLWFSGDLPMVPVKYLRDFVDNAPLDLIHESFWRDIPFGTGGVRGTVGFGPNRINRTVVALTIQAHCSFLDRVVHTEAGKTPERAVVIANDVRRFLDIAGSLKFLGQNPYHADNSTHGVSSRSLAYLAAEVYASNGFVVYIMAPHDDHALLTTPELSYLIRRLCASGGVNMSASHNPPDDNGIKIYDENGGQYLPPRDETLTKMAEEVHSINHMPYQTAVGKGLIRDVPTEALADYKLLYMKRAHNRGLRSTDRTRILFTPLSGCGEQTVGRALTDLDYIVRVPPREGPDGTFAAIPLLAPNPEVEEATARSKLEADAFGARVVLATDPDADRLGAEVHHRGEWRHLTGNQIATILAYYLLLDVNGPQLRGAVYETIVTTLAVKAIADRACCHVVDDLLVGFKYIGEAVQNLSDELGGETDDVTLLAFAAEESHGYLDTPQLRDKDAMSGALYLAKLHEMLARGNRTLVDYLESIYDDIGQFGDRGRSISILGSVGVRTIRDTMDKIRQQPPERLGEVDIEEVRDYWSEADFGPISSGTDREARNVLVLLFSGGRFTLRPSGTEPKLKVYVQTALCTDGSSAQEYADTLSDLVYRDILQIMGYTLDEVFSALPDVIPLEGKLKMQDTLVPELGRMLSDEETPLDSVIRWLMEEVSALIPGESAWEIAVPALRSAAQSWNKATRGKFGRILEVARG